MMMLGPDKKKTASVILGKLGGDLPPADPVESDESAGLKAAMGKLISAVHAKDEDSAVSAMQEFLEMHESSEPESDEVE